MRKYDVVVIGAGNGGLAAATKVLNAGKTCLVCEKHNIPYDKIVLGAWDKSISCQEEKIDVFIDDSPKHCQEVQKGYCSICEEGYYLTEEYECEECDYGCSKCGINKIGKV